MQEGHSLFFSSIIASRAGLASCWQVMSFEIAVFVLISILIYHSVLVMKERLGDSEDVSLRRLSRIHKNHHSYSGTKNIRSRRGGVRSSMITTAEARENDLEFLNSQRQQRKRQQNFKSQNELNSEGAVDVDRSLDSKLQVNTAIVSFKQDGSKYSQAVSIKVSNRAIVSLLVGPIKEKKYMSLLRSFEITLRKSGYVEVDCINNFFSFN